VVRSNEFRRHVHRRIEVPVARGVEGKGGRGVAAMALPIRTNSARIPERPSRFSRSSRDPASVGLKEVDVVLWTFVG